MLKQKKNPLSIIFIGHLAIDTIIRFKRLNKPSIGGTVSFGSLALRKYSTLPNIGLISRIGSKNFNNSLLKIFRNKNIDLFGLKWSDTLNTNFVLDYVNHSRTLTLKSRSPDLNFSDFPNSYRTKQPDIIVLSPFCNEISYDYVSPILKEFPNAFIGIDLQGFIRNIDNEGKVSYIPENQTIKNMCKKIYKIIFSLNILSIYLYYSNVL